MAARAKIRAAKRCNVGMAIDNAAEAPAKEKIPAERSVVIVDDDRSFLQRLAKALEKEGAEHVYAFTFNHVPHHHVHVVARYPGTPHEFWGPRVDEWPDAPRGGEAEIAALCNRLRATL